MSQELYYTSVPRGLLPGKSGFCTVAATRQLGAALMDRLESLSNYRPLFPPHHARASANPLTQAHLRISVGGRTRSLLSRIGPAGLDYTGRTNVFAHHVVLEPEEHPAGGPAWLLQQAAFQLDGGWQGEPRYLEPRTPPRGDVVAGPCREWKRVTGDAGWGGALAERFEQEPSQVVYLIFESGFEPLPLLAESLMLLPPERRWDVTFSTYYTGLPPGVSCVWRCVVNGSEEAKKAAAMPGTINLCVPVGQASGGERVDQARTGQAARRKPAVAAVPLPSSPLPHPVRLPEKAAEPTAAWPSERPRSRVWPFLGGVLTGMILMACVAGVMGYFYAVRPRLAAEDKRKELDVEIAKQGETIESQKIEIVSKSKEIESKNTEIQNAKNRQKTAKDTFDKQMSKIENARKEDVKTKVKELFSSKGDFLGKPLKVKVEAETPAGMMKQYIKQVEEQAQNISKTEHGTLEDKLAIRDAIINEIQKTNGELGNDGLKKAIDSALKEQNQEMRPGLISKISPAFIFWYKELFDFGSVDWKQWLDCEREYHIYKWDKEAEKPSHEKLTELYKKINPRPQHVKLKALRLEEFKKK